MFCPVVIDGCKCPNTGAECHSSCSPLHTSINETNGVSEMKSKEIKKERERERERKKEGKKEKNYMRHYYCIILQTQHS
jgi:hypothetical protein